MVTLLFQHQVNLSVFLTQAFPRGAVSYWYSPESGGKYLFTVPYTRASASFISLIIFLEPLLVLHILFFLGERRGTSCNRPQLDPSNFLGRWNPGWTHPFVRLTSSRRDRTLAFPFLILIRCMPFPGPV